MEDLNASGYVMKNCSKRLDASQSKTVLSRMAKFHAASVVYFKQVDKSTLSHFIFAHNFFLYLQNGPYPKSFKTGMYDEDSAADCEAYIGNLFKSLVASLIERKRSNQFLELIVSPRVVLFSYIIFMSIHF